MALTSSRATAWDAQWGLLAGAGLIVDYILTVAVSVAAGVAAVTSAIPSVASATVPIGLVVIVLLVAGNLRGVRDSAAAFAAPTFMFVAAIALIVIVGLIKAGSHGFHPVPAAPHPATEALGVLLVLRAFASGATAMTGIEVISNAVPVFRPPEAVHARQTLGVMVGLLISMFVGVVLVAHFDGAAPGGGQTVLSQIAHRSVGSGVAYGFVQVATTLVLLVAANSAFNGFPRLLYVMARDGFAPRVFLRMGDRLAFTNGILVLAVPAALIYAAFGGQTSPADPAVRDRGVPRLHARSERDGRALVAPPRAGVARRAGHQPPRRRPLGRGRGDRRDHQAHPGRLGRDRARPPHRDRRAGASTITISAPTRRSRHDPKPGSRRRPFAWRHPGSRRRSPRAWPRYRTIRTRCTASPSSRSLHSTWLRCTRSRTPSPLPNQCSRVHVSPTEDEAERFQRSWQAWGDHLPLEVLVSPYRATVAPLANYIAALHRQRPDVTLTLVVPEIVVAKPWQRILHNRIAARLRASLIAYEGIIITTVPFHLPREQVARGALRSPRRESHRPGGPAGWVSTIGSWGPEKWHPSFCPGLSGAFRSQSHTSPPTIEQRAPDR